MVRVIHKSYPSRHPKLLIEDLVPIIIEVGQPWASSDLVRLVRVSPAWQFPVERALYSSITLKSLVQWRLLTSTLRSRSSLTAFVRRIAFDDDPVTVLNDSSLDKAAQAMEELFSLLPRLVSLRVGGVGPYARSSFMAAMAYLPVPDRLEELEVDASLALGSTSQVPRMADRNLIWTERTPSAGIRSLKLTNVHLTFRMPVDRRGLPPNLESLYMNNASIPNLISLRHYPPLKSLSIVTRAARLHDPFAAIKYIVTGTRDTIERVSHIAIHGAPCSWEHYRWIFPICPKLKYLETDEMMYSRTWFPNFDMDERMPSLEEWTIWSVSEEDRDDADNDTDSNSE